MPEGLQRFAGGVAELLEEFAGVAVMVAADVAYGACCVDDVAAKSEWGNSDQAMAWGFF